MVNLKALAKGAVRRLYGRFNPDSEEYGDTVGLLNEWQGGNAGPDTRDEAFNQPTRQTPNERARAFNKLAAQTKMRRNAQTGEREFLLHRGIGAHERSKVLNGNKTNYTDTSSWTPHHEVAKRFAADYSGFHGDDRGEIIAKNPEHIKNHVLSSWIPESKIKGVPNQLGVSGNHSNEHEVVVGPHSSEHIDYAPKPTKHADLKEQIKARINPVTKSLEDRIRAKFQKQPLQKSLPLKPDFPPGQLDANLHGEQRWKGHEPQVYHGFNPNNDMMPPSEKGVSHRIKFIGDHQPKAVIKAPLGQEELKIPKEIKDGPDTSYLLHPSFRTSHREAAYHLAADKVFGLGDFVPKTTVFRHPTTNEPWSAQEFISDAQRLKEPRVQLHRYDHTNDLHKLALMDTILGHNDRHGGNVLVDRAGRIHMIDNASAFDYAHKFQTSLPKYATHTQFNNVSSNTHRWLNKLSEKALTEHLTQAGAPTEIIKMAQRRLAEAKRWSKTLMANPGASQELRSGLRAIQTHQFGNSPLLDESRKLIYGRIRRGKGETPVSSDPDQTQIGDDK